MGNSWQMKKLILFIILFSCSGISQTTSIISVFGNYGQISSSILFPDSVNLKKITSTLTPLSVKGMVGTRGSLNKIIAFQDSVGREVLTVLADSDCYGALCNALFRVGIHANSSIEGSLWGDEDVQLSEWQNRSSSILLYSIPHGSDTLSITDTTGFGKDRMLFLKDTSPWPHTVYHIKSNIGNKITLNSTIMGSHAAGDTVYPYQRGAIYTVNTWWSPHGRLYICYPLAAHDTAGHYQEAVVPSNAHFYFEGMNGTLHATNGLVNATTNDLAPYQPLNTGLTFGSVPFIGSDGYLRQNNQYLFWDSIKQALGIFTNHAGLVTVSTGNHVVSLAGASSARPVFEFIDRQEDANSQNMGTINWVDSVSIAADKSHARIGAITNGAKTNNRGGAITFGVKYDSASGVTEKMRITEKGIGIGTSSISYPLVVTGTAGSTTLRILSGDISYTNPSSWLEGTASAYGIKSAASTGLSFFSNNASTARVVIDTSGKTNVSGKLNCTGLVFYINKTAAKTAGLSIGDMFLTGLDSSSIGIVDK
jgi:hypothetical protein